MALMAFMRLVVIITLIAVCVFVTVVAVVVVIAVMAIVAIITLVAILTLVQYPYANGLMHTALCGPYCMNYFLQILCNYIVRMVSGK